MAWNQVQDEVIKRYYGKIPSTEIRDKYLPEKTEGAIRGRARRLGLNSYLHPQNYKFKPESSLLLLEEKKNRKPSSEALQDLWNELYIFQRKSSLVSSRVDEANVKITTDTPIGIAFLSDAHVGSISCKYEELEERIQAIVDIPNLYVINCGDSVDNYLPTWHNTGMFGEVVPPELQKILVEHQFKKLKGRWIASVQGCHDEASHTSDDFDYNKWLCSELECYNLGFGGFLNVTVGDITYKIHARHKYRFNSAFNLTNTVKRLREQVGDFDIGAIGHHHQATIEQLTMPDKDRIFIRPGSFKAPDRWARNMGYYDTGAFIPTVVLDPKERLMLPFLHLEQASKFLSCIDANS